MSGPPGSDDVADDGSDSHMSVEGEESWFGVHISELCVVIGED